jgi:hypothetical protein
VALEQLLVNSGNRRSGPPGRDSRRGTALLQNLSASLMALRQVSQRHSATRVFEVGQVTTRCLVAEVDVGDVFQHAAQLLTVEHRLCGGEYRVVTFELCFEQRQTLLLVQTSHRQPRHPNTP